MQVKANAVASAADIVFFFFINYIFLNLFFEVKQMAFFIEEYAFAITIRHFTRSYS